MMPDPYEPHLRQAESLFAQGEIVKAGQIWQAILKQQPSHPEARERLVGVKQHLLALRDAELPTSPAPAPTSPTSIEAPPPMPSSDEEDTDKLLREAVQLYDMGLLEDAISKWERVLLLEPHRQEIRTYLQQARVELGMAASAPPPPVAQQAPAPAAPNSDPVDLKLRQAEHLLALQRHEEAAFTFQQALGLSPGDARALQGLERCRKPSAAASPNPVAHSTITHAPMRILLADGILKAEEPSSLAPSEPQGIQPPAALLKAVAPPREGLAMPDRLQAATELLPWLKDPKILAGIAGGLLTLALGLGFLQGYRKDRALQEEVRAAKAAAAAPAAQLSQPLDLTESPESLREEAEANLVADPLRAYLRAEALLNRKPGDAAAALLLEKARTGLQGAAIGASLPEFQKHLQNGDLEAALKVMDALLRSQPSDGDLRSRAARMHLALCSAHGSQARWEEAREDLLRARALFPNDKSWQLRLRLLEHIKVQPKAQQAAWLPLLG